MINRTLGSTWLCGKTGEDSPKKTPCRSSSERLAITLRACLLMFALVTLSGCGTHGPAYAPPSSIAVTLTQVPPSTMPTGAQAQIIANVANDSANMGVNWTVSCSGPSCGSFNPAHTASGIATVFTAPASLPPGNSVNITAVSAADTTRSVTVTVGIVSGITLAITQPPPASVQTASQTVMGATVQGDASNSGVDWTVTCGSSSCGTFDPIHTASGATSTYYAPDSIPARSNVVITATSTADITKTAVVALPITALISIAFTQAPPATLLTTAPAAIIATVNNDPAGLGVDWVATCGNSSCGSFGPPHTASGQPTTFTAPATLPPGNTVLLTAIATADRSKSVSAAVSVNGIASSVSINFIQLPPASLQTAAVGTLAAAVTDDTSGLGMDWTVNCSLFELRFVQSRSHDQWCPDHVSSTYFCSRGRHRHHRCRGYRRPDAGGDGNRCHARAGRSALLNGQYAFLITGTDANGFYSAGGSISTDGAGNVISGEEDFADPDLVQHVTLTGTYAIGGDGSGALKLLASDSGIGANGVQTFSFTVVSPERALLFDSSQNSTGTLDLQTSSAFTLGAFSGGYAFALSGVDLTKLGSAPLTLGGVLTADGGGNLSDVIEDVSDEGHTPPIILPLVHIPPPT